MPYSKKAGYYHHRRKKPKDFVKTSFQTVPLSHTKYRGTKFDKGECKAIIGILKKNKNERGKRGGKIYTIQSILEPKSKPKKPKIKQKYLVSLKREQSMANKGWKVIRTQRYLDVPKKAVGKKGYPYAVLNKKKHYETFYTWKERSSKIKKANRKYKKKVEKRIKKGKKIGWGW